MYPDPDRTLANVVGLWETHTEGRWPPAASDPVARALNAIMSVKPSSRGHPPTAVALIRWLRGDTCRLRRRRPVYDLLVDWDMNPDTARAVCALLLGTIRLDAAYDPALHGSALLAQLQPGTPPPPTPATVRMWVRTALRASAVNATSVLRRTDSGPAGADDPESELR